MLASGIVLGIAAGWLSGGKLGRLADLEVRWWPLLVLAIGLRVIAPSIGESLVVWILSFGAIGLVAAVNRDIPGMWLIVAGAIMNLIVVLANSAMPVDARVAASVGVAIPADGLHRELQDGDLLPFLTDVIPVPVVSRVYSVGDAMLAVGGFWLPFHRMRTS
jgi:hypothetical protein